jgi:hypothetical protein
MRRQFHVQRVFVSFRVNGNGLDSQLMTGANDPQRNLAAICDKDLFERK